MTLVEVEIDNRSHIDFLYKLQKERYSTNNINIEGLSPLELPTYDQHRFIVETNLYNYKYYFLYMDEYQPAYVFDLPYHGAIYLKENNEISIFIRKKYQNKGLGCQCLKEFLSYIPEKQIIATVNVNNESSNKLFKKCGFKHTGNFYVLNK